MTDARASRAAALLQRAERDRRAGRLDAAAAGCEAALALAPEAPPALELLAMVRHGQGRSGEAVALLRRLVRRRADDPRLRFNLATGHHRLGDAAAATRQFRAVLALAPADPGGHAALATLDGTAGRVAAAIAGLDRAVALDPARRGPRLTLAGLLAETRQTRAAAARLAEDARRWPGDPTVAARLGRLLEAAGDRAPAAAWLRRAVVLAPETPAPWHDLGTLLIATAPGAAEAALAAATRLAPTGDDALVALARLRTDRHDAAAGARLARRAIAAAPGRAGGHGAEAAASLARDHLVAAAAAARRALALAPGDAGARLTLGLALRGCGDLAGAVGMLKSVVASAPAAAAAADALANLGLIAWGRGRTTDAEATLGRAARLVPGHPEAAFNQGLIRLATGRLAAGWPRYRLRFAALRLPERRPAPALWTGGLPDGGRLLVWREQGLGDELMFLTCLPGLVRFGDRLIVETDPRLTRLVGAALPWATVVAAPPHGGSPAGSGGPAGSAGSAAWHAPAGTAAGLLRPRLASFPTAPAPLLRPDPARATRWRDRLAALGPGLKIGLCWRSARITSERVGAYSRLDDWRAVFALSPAQFIVLQYDDCAAEVAAAEARFGVRLVRWHDLDLRDDLDEVASLVAALDLVISAPTAVAELAGALGVPVWRFAHPATDWTRLGTAVRPWFGAMRSLALTPATPPDRALATAARALRRLARPRSDDGSRARLAALEAAALAERWIADAQALRDGGNTAAAARRLRAAAALVPGAAAAHGGLGTLALDAGQTRPARAATARAVALAPDHPGWLSNLASVDLAEGRPGDATARLRYAAAAAPMSAAILTNLGAALQDGGDLAGAVALHRRAIAREPGLADAHSNLGLAAQRRGDTAAAAAAYDRAVACDPAAARPRYNRALLHLQEGRLAAGWIDHEARFAAQAAKVAAAARRLPRWSGAPPTPDRRLLIWGEQGIGDEVLLAALTRRLPTGALAAVTLACDRRLVALFRRSFMPAAVVALDAPSGDRPAAETQCPAASLAPLVAPRLSALPARPVRPHLVPDPARRAAFAAALAALPPGLRVGFAWRSRLVTAGRGLTNSRPAAWGPVLALPGIAWVGLQGAPRADERAEAEAAAGSATRIWWPAIDLVDDLNGVAALVAALDLVIAGPSSTAEFAAAVGTPVWRLETSINWTRLGTRCRPWLPAQRLFLAPPGRPIATLLPTVARALARLGPSRSGGVAPRHPPPGGAPWTPSNGGQGGQPLCGG